MARPKKADGLKQPTVAPAPAMVPMPAMQMQQHQQLQHQMTPQHQLSQAIAQQPPMQGMPGALPPQQRTIGIDEFIRVRDSVSSSLYYYAFSGLISLLYPQRCTIYRLSNLPTCLRTYAKTLASSLIASLRQLIVTWSHPSPRMQPAASNISIMDWRNHHNITITITITIGIGI